VVRDRTVLIAALLTSAHHFYNRRVSVGPLAVIGAELGVAGRPGCR
jgi:hypothetical protein